jgi:branched-chain amino acid transport system permease protein
MTVYIITGLVAGGVYAILSLGLVITNVSSGVFNFGHAAIAFTVAALFNNLTVVHHWAPLLGGALSILVAGPLLGLALWALLFRTLATAHVLVKTIVTVGVYVALPPIATFIWIGNRIIQAAPGLAGSNPGVHSVLGVHLSDDQIIALVASAAVALGISMLLRLTRFGLRMRAVVDASRIAATSGIDTRQVSAASWALGAGLAGLAGVLISPILGLNSNQFALLMVSSFAAVVVARFRSLLAAFLAALGIGVVSSIAVKYLPGSGVFSGGQFSSLLPFAVILFAVAVFYFMKIQWGGSVSVSGVAPPTPGVRPGTVTIRWPMWIAKSVIWLAVAIAGSLLLSAFWLGGVEAGFAVAMVMLSYTLVVGEGGMPSLCQVAFAGVGASACGQLVGVHGMPVVPALLLSGLVGLLCGAVVGFVLVRLTDLYFALVTLALGLLLDNTLFINNWLYNSGAGVSTANSVSPQSLYWLFAAIVTISVIGVAFLQRSTFGLALSALRTSPAAASTIGIRSVGLRLAVFGIAAFLAALGGAMFATYSYVSLAALQFPTLVGLVWLAVVVTMGLRSPVAAVAAGLAIEVFPLIINLHLPASFVNLVPVLFGLGAIGIAKDPRGAAAQLGENFARLCGRLKAVVGGAADASAAGAGAP